MKRFSLLAALVCVLGSEGAEAATNVSGTISANTTWSSAGSPYVVTGSVTVATGVTLTIQDGVTVMFNAGQTFTVNGTLVALGSSSAGITFTANSVTPTPGFWGYVGFNASAGASQVSYVNVNYAGGLSNTAVWVQGCSLTIDHLAISQSSRDGIQVLSGGAVTLTNASSSTNAWTGFVVYGGGALTLQSVSSSGNAYGIFAWTGSSLALNAATLSNNTSWAMGTEHDTHLSGLATVSMSGNGPGGSHNGIDYRGGTIAGNEHWTAGVDWYMNAATSVGVNGVLTIDPGVNVRAATNCNLDVSGKLLAQGTPAAGILMTGQTSTRGAWVGLTFEAGANPSASLVSYLTLSYAGNTGSNVQALQVNGSSPTFDNLIVSNSSTDGILISGAGAHPTIQNSQVTSNARHGLEVSAGAALTLNGTTFTSNGWYAMLMDPTTVLSGLVGLSAVSNGGNSIGIRSAIVSTAVTWHAPGIPYAVTGQMTFNSGAALTIDPGTTLRFSYHVGALVFNSGAALTAVGTAPAPIVFTSEAATPAAGDWGPIIFDTGTAVQSRIRYATIAYGGAAPSGAGSIQIYSSAPLIDHVTFQTPSYAGISIASTAAAPTITNCAFLGPAAGIQNFFATTITARYSYWNNVSGPSGAGTGTGVYVSGGVLFEPWLTSPPTDPDWVTSNVVANRTFNPAIGISQTLNFALVESGAWTVTWKDAAGNPVRTLTGTGSTGSATWDGKNDSGVAQPNGTYSYTVASTSGTGDVAAPVRGISIINNALAFTLTTPAVSQAFFSPNGDGVQDVTTITSSASFDAPSWTVNVRAPSTAIVRSFTGSGSSISYTWDGKDSGAVVQPDGLYTLEILATDGGASTSASAPTTLDDTPPAVAITAPATGLTLSNVYNNGVDAVAITGSAQDTNFTSWQLDYSANGGPWTLLANATTPLAVGTFFTWPTLAYANGTYSLRVTAKDKAGNTTTNVQSPVIVGNFSVAEDVLEFNSGTAGHVTYTSAIPFTLNETLSIRDQGGATVRTLLSGAARTQGNVTDPWDGRNDAGALVPDGPYFYVASVTDGTHTLLWDLTNQFRDDANYYADDTGISLGQTFDPFNNQPGVVSYYFPTTGQVSIGLTTGGAPPAGCPPQVYCLAFNRYEEAGSHTFTWAGVDSTGAYRPDLATIGVVSQRYLFSKNAVVVFGTKPSLTNVAVSPPIYGPAAGSQTVSFDLATYQSGSASASVTFARQPSAAPLRTVSVSGLTPGHRTITWDGRADNGMLVAAGYYTVTVTVTDTLGNRQSGQILTTVRY